MPEQRIRRDKGTNTQTYLSKIGNEVLFCCDIQFQEFLIPVEEAEPGPEPGLGVQSSRHVS